MNPNTSTNAQVLFIALVATCIGFLLGVITTQYLSKDTIVSESKSENQNAEDSDDTTNNTTVVTDEEESNSNNVTETATSGFTISIASLPEAQQFAVRSMGVEGDELVITPEMVACAEAKVGKERVAEIKNGAGVSMSEGVTLIGCYGE